MLKEGDDQDLIILDLPGEVIGQICQWVGDHNIFPLALSCRYLREFSTTPKKGVPTAEACITHSRHSHLLETSIYSLLVRSDAFEGSSWDRGGTAASVTAHRRRTDDNGEATAEEEEENHQLATWIWNQLPGHLQPTIFGAVYRGHLLWTHFILERQKRAELSSFQLHRVRDASSNTPLHVAAKLGDLHILRYLIQFESERKEGIRLMDRRVPLESSSTGGGTREDNIGEGMPRYSLDCTKYLNMMCLTPVHYAVRSGNLESVRLLLSPPAFVLSTFDDPGCPCACTPLHLAAR